MDFKKISQQIRALDKPEKLKILALLAEEGRKSISAVARELNIHFSTTHKYLEQLEAANLVHSKSVKEDRLKRYFYVKDFNIRLSPTELTASAPSEKEPSFKIINDYGVRETLNLNILVRAYIAAGIPYSLAHSSAEHLKKEMYVGITYCEIKLILGAFFESQLSLLQDSLRGLELSRIREKTIKKTLYLLHPDLLKKHTDGEIFIRNLGRPRLLNFVHDVRGISVHGIDGDPPKTLEKFTDHLCTTTDKINKFCIDNVHGFNSLNYILAPLHHKKPIDTAAINSFLGELAKHTKTMYVSIDIGLPHIMKELPLSFFMKEDTRTYSHFSKEASELANLITISAAKHENIKLVVNVWDTAEFDKFKAKHDLKSVYVANLLHDWQTEAAYYMGSICRTDCRWRHWLRLTRVGELQNTTINLPRIAATSNNYLDFVSKVKQLVTEIVDSYSDLAELSVGEYLRTAPVLLKSSVRKEWHYCEINDCIYSISLCGGAEAFSKLGVVASSDNYEKLLSSANKPLKNIALRIQLKEEHNPLVLQRFCYLDNKNKITNFKSYSAGLGNVDFPLSNTHKYLLGGHCSIGKDLASGGGLTFFE